MKLKIGKVNGIYDAKKAEAKAVLRRRESKIQCLKVATDTNLKKFVIEGMLEDQSPEGISGRLKEVEKIFNMQAPKPYTNLWKVLMVDKLKNIFTIMQSRKEWSQEQKKVSIDGRTMIDQRPKKAEKRLEFGHFEGDFIESGKDGLVRFWF